VLFTNLAVHFIKVAFKGACQRGTAQKVAEEELLQSAQNLVHLSLLIRHPQMLLGVLFTVFLSVGLAVLWIIIYGSLHDSFPMAIWMYCFSIFIESLADAYSIKPIMNFDYSVDTMA